MFDATLLTNKFHRFKRPLRAALSPQQTFLKWPHWTTLPSSPAQIIRIMPSFALFSNSLETNLDYCFLRFKIYNKCSKMLKKVGPRFTKAFLPGRQSGFFDKWITSYYGRHKSRQQCHIMQISLNSVPVSYPLIELHVKLMRKLKKSVNFDRWEKAAAKYAHTYSDQDGWEIERFGYKKISLAVKLRLLKVNQVPNHIWVEKF